MQMEKVDRRSKTAYSVYWRPLLAAIVLAASSLLLYEFLRCATLAGCCADMLQTCKI